MIWDRHIHALIPQNPLAVRELYRQQRTTSFGRGFLESTGIVAVALCFSVAMLLCAVYGSTLGGRLGLVDFEDPIEFLAWTFHAITLLRLLAAGVFSASSITSSSGSDELMVTPLSNWQLLGGQWWAALHRIRGWMLALGIVQIGVVASIAFGLLISVSWSSSNSVITIHGLEKPEWLTATRLLFIIGSAIGITVLETLCCTALGMVAAIVVCSRFSLLCAVSLRFAPVLIFAYFPKIPLRIPFGRSRLYTWFSFADAGTGALIQMTHPINIYASSFDRGILGLCAVAIMLTLYLSLSLTVALAVMRRSRQ